jgi:crotonobetainyl-CoA:carnitine CoA-transferase CaiB-like acyl-CoA transferase
MALPPLDGIRVLDFTAAMAGPRCGMLLGDFGADVLKIEPPEGDYARRWGVNRYGTGGQFSGLFLALNRNKRSVVLDLKTEEGRDAVAELTETADVIIENYRPGVADRLGIGYASVSARNPGIVYCSISGFGQNGPLREHPGLDMLMQAYTGHMSVTGEEGRPSIRNGPSPVDLLAGTSAAFGILLALRERDKTGRGQYLETSLYEAAIEMVAHFIADYTGSGQVPPKSGPYFAFASPYGIFDASDREFYLGASHQKSYEQFCHLIDREDLIADPRFTSNADRITNRAALHEELFPIFRTRTAQEWVTLLEDAGIPTSLVETLAEVTRQEQMAARELLVPTGVDDVAMIGIALKMGLTPGSVRRPPPELGADTEAVLAEQRQSRNTVAADAGAVTPRPAQPGNLH